MATTSRILWGEAETDMLVSERRRRNYKYHYSHRGSKKEFWNSVSRRIHRRYGRTFTAHQCKRKFRNLIKEYRVNK